MWTWLPLYHRAVRLLPSANMTASDPSGLKLRQRFRLYALPALVLRTVAVYGWAPTNVWTTLSIFTMGACFSSSETAML